VSFGGLAYFGLLGLFLGPVLLATVLVMFVIYQEEYQQGGMLIGVPTDPREDTKAHNGASKALDSNNRVLGRARTISWKRVK
jgi:hypothetical protein